MDFSIGDTLLNRYLLVRQVGRGGMGVTYLADDQALGKPVAIKVQLQSAVATDQNIRARQRSEAKNIASLDHPNVVRMIDFFEIQGNGFLVTDFIDGVGLDTLIRQREISADRPEHHALLLNYLTQIISGLEAIHEVGIVHRDMKPSNILIDRDGVAKIMDFGISKSSTADDLTTAGIVIGTALYISPEQARGHDATALSDLYAFGVIAFELSQGFRPFIGTSAVDVATKHIIDPVPPLIAPINPQFEQLIQSLLAKDPSDRPQSAQQVRKALEHISQSTPPPQSPPLQQSTHPPQSPPLPQSIPLQQSTPPQHSTPPPHSDTNLSPPSEQSEPLPLSPPKTIRELSSKPNSHSDTNQSTPSPHSTPPPQSTPSPHSTPPSHSDTNLSTPSPQSTPSSHSDTNLSTPSSHSDTNLSPPPPQSTPSSHSDTNLSPPAEQSEPLPISPPKSIRELSSKPKPHSDTDHPTASPPRSAVSVKSFPPSPRPPSAPPAKSFPPSSPARPSPPSPPRPPSVKIVDHQFRIIMGGLLIIMALALSAIIYMTALIIGGSAGI